MTNELNNAFVAESIVAERGKTKNAMQFMHSHDDAYEIYQLLDGKQTYLIEDKCYEMQSGDIVFIPKGVLHKTERANQIRTLINFDDRLFDGFLYPQAKEILLSVFDKILVHPDAQTEQELNRLFTRIVTAKDNGDGSGMFFALTHYLDALSALESISEKKRLTNSLLQSAIDYIQKNYSTINTLDDIANALYVSKYHLCYIFKKQFDISINTYLTKIKLKAAKEKLSATKMSVSDVAESCGFSSSAYFCNVFKQFFGESPLRYRQIIAAKEHSR